MFIFYILYTLRVSHQEWIRDQILVPKSMAGRPENFGVKNPGVFTLENPRWQEVPYKMGRTPLWNGIIIDIQWIIPENSRRKTRTSKAL